MWNKALNSDIIKHFLDVGIAITKVTSGVGLFKTALAGVAAYLVAFKKINFGTMFKDVYLQLQNYSMAMNQLKTLAPVNAGAQVMSGAAFAAGPMNAYAAAVSNLSARQQAAALTTAGLTKEQIALTMAYNQVDAATIRQVLGTTQLATAKTQVAAVTMAEVFSEQNAVRVKSEDALESFLLAHNSELLTAQLLDEAVKHGVVTEATAAEIAAKYNLAKANQTAAASSAGVAGAAKTAGSGIVGMLGGFIKMNPVGFVLTIISAIAMFAPLIGKAFKSTEEKMQDLEQEWSTLEEKINTASNDFKTLKTSADSVIPRFAELAEGVDKFGNNVSLTEDEYKEFLSLNNQIADMFPEINNGMDANGNAMLSLSYTSDTLTESLWNLVEAERAAANEEIAKTMPDVLDNIMAETDLVEDEKGMLEARIASYQSARETIENLYSDEAILEYKNRYGDNWRSEWQKGIDASSQLFAQDLQYAFNGFENVEGWSALLNKFYIDGQIDWYRVLNSSEMQNALAGAENQIDNLNTRIQQKWNRLDPVLTAWVGNEQSYKDMSTEMQTAVQAMIGNVDFAELAAKGIDTEDEIQNWITNNILNPIDAMTPIAQQKLSRLMSLDAGSMSFTDFENEVNALAEDISAESGMSVDDILSNTGYSDLLADYEDTISNVVNALAEGEGYFDKYEEGTNALELATNELYNKIYSLSPDEVTRAFDIIKNYGINTWDELEEALENKTFDLVLDYNKEAEGIEAVVAAVDESVSATGLSAESVTNLQQRYQDLESYDPSRLFEMTTNGIHLNAQELNKLEAEYKNFNKTALDNKLTELQEQYDDLTQQIEVCTDASERANLYSQRNNVLTQINDTAELAARYAGLTSAYNEWQQAQDGGNERDMYTNLASARQEIQDEMADGWLDDGTREYLELLSGKDLSTAAYDELLSVYQQLGQAVNSSGYSVYDFFTKDSDGNATSAGIFNFLDAVKAAQTELDQEWVKLNEDGSYTFDFGVNGDKAVAEALGISEELVQIILRAARDAGFEVNLDSAYSELAYFEEEFVAANKRMKEIGATDFDFNFESTDIYDLENQIVEAQEMLKGLQNEDGTIKVGVSEEDYRMAEQMLFTLIHQKQILSTPAILQVDASEASATVQSTLDKINQFTNAYNEYEYALSIGADVTEATAKMQEVKQSFTEEEIQIAAELGIDLTQSNAEITAAIQSAGVTALNEIIATSKEVPETEATEYTVTGTGLKDLQDINSYWDTVPATKSTKYSIYKTTYESTVEEGAGSVNGTANQYSGWSHTSGGGRNAVANGTAHATGSWGAPRTETALVGELGPELLVRGNRWTTIGDNGAEFTQVKKGDIIFNHKQTEDLLSKGYVTGRGKAYASGTAFSHGTGPGRSTVGSASFSGSGSGNGNGSQDAAEDAAEVFDWFEVLLTEINEQLELMEAKLENIAGFKGKNSLIEQMIQVNKGKLDTLRKGLKLYTDYANQLLSEIPAQYREMAQNGAVAIEEFASEADQSTLEAIQNYREWAENVADLQLQMEELATTIADLAKQKFDNIVDEFENIIGLFEGVNDRIDAMISLIEESGRVASTAYYEEMISSTNEQISQLTQESKELRDSLAQSLANGDIQHGSEQWYEMMQEIQEVETAIIEAQTQLEEYQNAINEIYWDNFENLINQFEYLTEETENMISLLGHEDLVDEIGNWTNEGIASLGLYAQQMEIAEYQATQYAKAIEDLNKDYADGKYSESEYLEKLNELQSAQYDSIEAYHEAQEAIVDLNETRVDAIKEGIEKEIDAYKELIEAKKEELDAEKDLYDFQKSVADQQKNIADIERRLASLSNDRSASAMAKRRQLEAELAEARSELEENYYDRSIEQQQEAYDKEAEAFEEEKNAEIKKWEEYLENVEQVVTDSLLLVQDNTLNVYDTLSATASEYGLTLSDAIMTPWESGMNAISSYQEIFNTASSETLNQLDAIYSAWKRNIDLVNEFATESMYGSNAGAYGTTSGIREALKPPTPEKPTTNSNNNNNNNNNNNTSSSSSGSIAVGGKINAGSARIYANYNGGGGGKQYFASDPIYTVLEEKNGYLKVRWHKSSSGVTGWFKKSDVKALATGTTNLNKSGIVNIDELGEELVLRAKNGRLTYMEKGSGVIPADLTSNLMSWGELNPQDMLDRNRPSIGVSPEINHTEISIDNSIGELIHIDNCSTETLPDVKKIVNEALEKHTQKLNQSLRKYAR